MEGSVVLIRICLEGLRKLNIHVDAQVIYLVRAQRFSPCSCANKSFDCANLTMCIIRARSLHASRLLVSLARLLPILERETRQM
jgi:hypothetical protein